MVWLRCAVDCYMIYRRSLSNIQSCGSFLTGFSTISFLSAFPYTLLVAISINQWCTALQICSKSMTLTLQSLSSKARVGTCWNSGLQCPRESESCRHYLSCLSRIFHSRRWDMFDCRSLICAATLGIF